MGDQVCTCVDVTKISMGGILCVANKFVHILEGSDKGNTFLSMYSNFWLQSNMECQTVAYMNVFLPISLF
jgi:hypothetical protein